MAALEQAKVGQAGFIFDFDDTLVYSHEVFAQAQQRFCQQMRHLGLYDDMLLPDLEAQDIANVQKRGHMAPECFPLALVQTYESYCVKYGQPAEPKEKEALTQLGWQVYEQTPREMSGARELLAELRRHYKGYRLLLFTQGERSVQQQRIEKSGFKPYFDAIKIVKHKDTAALRDLLAEQGIEPGLSWYVGNSLRADINPAIEAGLNAVHLNIDAWSYERQTPRGAYHSIESLEQFLALLAANTKNTEHAEATR